MRRDIYNIIFIFFVYKQIFCLLYTYCIHKVHNKGEKSLFL